MRDLPLSVIAACFEGLPEDGILRALASSNPLSRLSLVDDRVELFRDINHTHPAAVLFPPCDAADVSTAPLIARLRHEAPDISAGLLVRRRSPGRGVIEALRAGAEIYHWDTVEELSGIVRDVLDARALPAPDTHVLDALLTDLYPALCARILAHCVAFAHSSLDVSALADQFRMSRRSLTRRLRDASWPPPLEVVEWGRLLRASLIQWRGSSSAVSLARAAGFPSPGAMRSATQRLLGPSAPLHDVLASLTPLYVVTMLRRRLDAISKIAP